MIYLHKILPAAVLPIGMTILLVVVGLILHYPPLCWGGIGVLWMSSMPLVGNAAVHAMEGDRERPNLHQIPGSQAIVILSNASVTLPGDTPILERTEAMDRFDAGVALYRAGKAPILVLTGGWVPWQPKARPAGETLAEYVIEQGVPKERVLTTGRVMNTAAEAQAVVQLLREASSSPEGRAVILVTAAFHMRRAKLLFEQAGIQVFPFPVDYQTPAGRVFTILDLLPTAVGLERTEIALRELYGYLYYVLRG